MISVISLEKLLKVLSDEEKVLSGVLCSFSCKKNSEVEKFIKEDAIDFNKKGLARTYLIVSSCNGNNIILGYFTLAMKAFIIEDMQELDDELSKTQIKKVMRFVSRYNCEVNGVNAGFSVIPAILIAQLGKNDLYSSLITGSELLSYIYDVIKKAQCLLGGRFIFVEREENDKLDAFYKSNDFINFNSRKSGSVRLYQMFKYVK